MVLSTEAIDDFLFEEWPEATALRDALVGLEERLAGRLKVVAERIAPWCAEHSFSYVECDPKFAAINLAKVGWMSNDVTPRVYCSVAGLFPAGYRRVADPHPSVWVYTYGMPRQEQVTFRDALTARLEGRPGGWINDDCTRRGPAGQYAKSHGDTERIALARSTEALEEFVRSQLAVVLAVSGDVDEALTTI